MEITVSNALLQTTAEVALGGGLTVLTAWSLSRPLEARVGALESQMADLPQAIGAVFDRAFRRIDETGAALQALAQTQEASLAQALEQQNAMVAALQQAQVQLATSDRQQEAALIDLGERISRQSEVLAQIIERFNRPAAPPVPTPDPWGSPAAARLEFLERQRQRAAEAFAAPNPEEGQ